MADRKNFSSNQIVTEAQLDDAFADMENADRAQARDIGLRGVLDGLAVSPDSPESMILFVAAGKAISKSLGARIFVSAQQQVDMAVDELGASTIPAGGNERYVALFARFHRVESGPIGPDFGNNFVNFESDEGFRLAVVSGVEAAAGTAPLVPLDADDVLLCDVLLTPATTQILAGDIDISRAEYTFNETTADPFVIVAQNPVDAIKTLYAKVADILGGAVTFDAANVEFTGTLPTWADATNVTGTTPNPANTVENYIEGIVADLAASAGAVDTGTARIGAYRISESVTGSNNLVLPTGSLRGQLEALTTSSSIYIAAAGNWADGATNPAQSLQARINTSIIQRLASKTDASANGARYIGVDPSLAYFAGAETIGEVFTKLNAVASAGDNGAARIGFYSGGFTGGWTTSTPATIYAAIAALTRTTAGSDGASHVATEAVGTLSGATVRAQLNELDTEKAALTGATFTGEVRQPRLSPTLQNVGVIAANTQGLDTVGIIAIQSPAADNTDFNIAMPEPASGNPVLHLKFRGGSGSARRVWITNTASIGTSPPSDYYAYWEASTNSSAGCAMYWDGSRWRMIIHWNLTNPAGGGALAD